jgi:hypothetical protein
MYFVYCRIKDVISQDIQNQAKACKEAQAKSSNSTMDQNAYRQQDQIQRQETSLETYKVEVVNDSFTFNTTVWIHSDNNFNCLSTGSNDF